MINKCIDCGKKIRRKDAKRCSSCSKKGKLNPMYGKEHNKETKEKMKESQRDITGKNNPNWKNGRKISWGYVYIYMPNHPFAKQKYIKRANLIIEKHIGRYLKPEEVVHHKNQNKLDDKLSNLILCKNESEHQTKYHNKKKG